MERWLDAAYPPTDAELAYYKSIGIVGIAGYFKYSATDHVLNGWSDSDFKRVLAAGLKTMAYVSGYADPTWAGNRAASLGITICLDDEGGMRPDGTWVPAWLTASGAGLYGNGLVHVHAAPFHILAAYPGSDPGATWGTAYAPKPATPCGWQWQGSHNVDGLTVDSSWFDEAIGGAYGAGHGTSGGINMFLEAPFKVKAHAGCKWYVSAGGAVVTTSTPSVGGIYDVWNVSTDGLWYEIGTAANPHGTWWFKASDCGVIVPEPPASVTMDQVNAAIAAAIAKIPAPTGGITIEQVQSVIDAALAKLPASKTPNLWDVLKATFAAPSN